MKNTKKIPSIIYGTAWKENATSTFVSQALKTGFRAIDTANQPKHYNETLVGEAIQEWLSSGNQRNELFIQSKFTHPAGQDNRIPYNPRSPFKEQVEESFTSSLSHLGIDYLDSYLLHGPNTAYGISQADWEVWQAIGKLYIDGKIGLIGVSNVNVEQLKALVKEAEIGPMVVQNRCFANRGWDIDVREYCAANGILYQGFSLLTANPQVMWHPKVKHLATIYNKTTAQIIFRFCLQKKIIILTGTTSEIHMDEDLHINDFELREEDILLIEKEI